ncbi:MAG: fibronectin/fibrinogen-binding protein [Oscillatoriales cyanobacterium RM2_1_1]|nr:fibronectin/fibrinogen-binding protein [Oscillatoriales cyanobacterium SM2_3_0]NJO46270.1 fibronectin/fibrinogen-binding protein [Oscillatoriales cyanobacterium RM2_1_1]
MQSVDLTTLLAACAELRAEWLPARLEQVYQRDRLTISLGLRTLHHRGWLDISWHPQGARMCIGDSPPRKPDTFTFSDQLRHQLNGLALVAISAISPWERVIDLQFAKRPGEEPLWHLYVEIMNKYSNVVLTESDNTIVTTAHQVSAQQSSVRPIQTGQSYEFPPSLTDPIPSLQESQASWQERVSLIPGALKRQLFKNYRGLSPALVTEMIQAAGLHPEQPTDSLNDADWAALFDRWQDWLRALERQDFSPHWTATGYGVIPWHSTRFAPTPSPFPSQPSPQTIQELLNTYYTTHLNQQEFSQLRHQILQKLSSLLAKLRVKAAEFTRRLQQSQEAETHRTQADLLMAHLHQWQPGLQTLTLADFETGAPVTLTLNPEKNAVQNAQAYYKRHQKLKRARVAVEPLLNEVLTELHYLEQVEDSVTQIASYQTSDDLNTLEEIREELIQQGYLSSAEHQTQSNSNSDNNSEFYCYKTPSGFELWIGRNNKQNDRLTFKVAGAYDLWFHTQEIPGSHLLLRLNAGETPEDLDLQFAANLAAYYSRARQSDQAPVVYTQPKHIYKPKGAKPGMVIYKHETVIWGYPQRIDLSNLQAIDSPEPPDIVPDHPAKKTNSKQRKLNRSPVVTA